MMNSEAMKLLLVASIFIPFDALANFDFTKPGICTFPPQGEHEICLHCASPCEETCDDSTHDPMRDCDHICLVNRWQCAKDYVRGPNKKCILREECPHVGVLPHPVMAPEPHPSPSPTPPHPECPICIGAHNHCVKCGSSCPATCGVSAESILCTAECKINVCECDSGYAKAPDGTCVLQSECPPSSTDHPHFPSTKPLPWPPAKPLPLMKPLPPMGHSSPIEPLPSMGHSSPIKPLPPMEHPSPMGHSSPMKPLPPMGHSSPIEPLPSMGHPLPVKPLPPMGYPSPIKPLPPMEHPSPMGHSSPMKPLPPVGHSSPIKPIAPIGHPSPVETLSPIKPLPPMGHLSPIKSLPPIEHPSPMGHFSPMKPLLPIGNSSPMKPLPPMEHSSQTQPSPPMGHPSPIKPLPPMGYPSPIKPLPPMEHPSPMGHSSPMKPLPPTGHSSPTECTDEALPPQIDPTPEPISDGIAHSPVSPVCTGGHHDNYVSCGSACPAECGQPKNRTCTAECLINVCQCDEGFARDEEGDCIPEYMCPAIDSVDTDSESEEDSSECPVCTGGHHDHCVPCGGCPAICGLPRDRPCTLQCEINVCQCDEGYARNPDGDCIPEYMCNPDAEEDYSNENPAEDESVECPDYASNEDDSEDCDLSHSHSSQESSEECLEEY